MIKYLKLASYLSIAMAVSTVLLAGIGLTRVNKTVSDRADFLDKPNVIAQLRKLVIPKGNEDKTPPLVTQAIAFALRIDPPKPQKPPTPIPTGNPRSKIPTKKTTVVEKVAAQIDRNATFKLLATCVHENHPEKSLALIDFTSKGSKWIPQGKTVGHKVIHQINDGNIVLYQGGRKTGILKVPKKNAVSSLLKGSGTTITAAAPAYSGRTATNRPVKRIPKTTRNPAYKRPLRSRPARQSPEGARKAATRNTDELTAILNEMKTKPKDGSEKKGGENDLMKAVMKMLESSSKNAEAKKAKAKKAEAMKKNSN